jgi:uncharacterized protein (DUF305 family)
MKKSLIGIAAAAAIALLAGCSGNNDMAGMNHSSTAPAPTSSGQAAGNNADDVAFAQGMVPHHQQAIDMAKLVSTRSQNPKVLELAKKVEAAQDPEITKMNEWLKAWGAPASTSMPGMDHGSMPGMSGMMSAEDMKMLEQAKGAAFDKMWLEMMIKHHEGAVEMAKTELTKGSSADAKKLAQEIINAQQKEITEMQGMLKSA